MADDMWLEEMTNAWLFPSEKKEEEATPSTMVSTSGDQPHPSRSGTRLGRSLSRGGGPLPTGTALAAIH